MAVRGLYLLLALSLLALTSASASAASKQDGSYAGPYEQIQDVHNPEVVAVAIYAVNEHNKEKGTNLKFVEIFSGETQQVAGIGVGVNYRLGITADDGNNYEAVVYENVLLHVKDLTSFRMLLRVKN